MNSEPVKRHWPVSGIMTTVPSKVLSAWVPAEHYDRDIKALRVAIRDVLDLFVSPKNGRERKAAKYLRAALKEKP